MNFTIVHNLQCLTWKEEMQGHLTTNCASFPSILIICSTNTFESEFAFIERESIIY